MMYDLSRVERQRLANQVAPDYSLIRKCCACGKASNAKQLGQYGRCVKCAKVDQ